MLLGGRVIQGIGGGGLISLANICISDLFSMRYERQLPLVQQEMLIGNVEIEANILEWWAPRGDLRALADQSWAEFSQRRSRGGGVFTSIVSPV